MREICQRLGEKYDVYTIGQQFVGEPIKPEGCNFFILPYKDHNGQVLLEYQIKTYQPDIVIIQDDLFVMVRDGLDKVDFGKSKLLIYCAIDGEPVATTAQSILDKADTLIGMTNYGKRVLEDAGYEDIEMMYHGVDRDIFKPLSKEEKTNAKQNLSTLLSNIWQKDIKLDGKCLFYACGRNTNRKDFYSLYRSWGKFAKDKEDVVLLVNSIGYENRDMSHFDMLEQTLPKVDGSPGDMAHSKVIFFPAQSYFRGTPEKQIGQLTGCADCHYSVAIGEGFGMVMLESFSCGVPVIANTYSTHKELVGTERGFLAESQDDFMILSYGIGHKPVKINSMVEQLNKFYDLWKKDKVDETFKDNCINFANKYTWDLIAEKWVELIERKTQ